MSLDILFHLCTQHVSDINISIIRSLRLCCWITTSVVLFSVRCVLEIWCGRVWVVSVLQHGRKLLMMDILMSETCWVHKKWNKIASDIKLVSYSSATNRSAQRCACLHIHTSTYTRVHKHKPLQTNVYYTHTHTHTYIYIYILSQYIYIHMYKHSVTKQWCLKIWKIKTRTILKV